MPNLQIFNAKPVSKSSKNLEHNIKAVDVLPLGQNVKEVKQKDSIKVKTKLKHQLANQWKNESSDQADDHDLKKEQKRKRQKSHVDLPKKDGGAPEQGGDSAERKAKRKAKKMVNSEIEVIDDAEAAFSELFEAGAEDLPAGGMEVEEEINKTLKQAQSASLPSRKKKSRKQNFDPSLLGSSTIEVGMGGPSSWDD